MRNCGCWLVCGALLVPQLGCWGDALSVDRRGATVPGDEPGEEPRPEEPVASVEPLTPGEGEPPMPGEPSTPVEPPPVAPPPFNTGAEPGGCMFNSDFRVDTPLNDTRGTGFSALDMLAIFNEQGPGALTWLDGTTTTLSIAVRAASNTSVVDDAPRGQGYCVPPRHVRIQLRVESADGRLAEDLGGELVAIGYDGNIESMWLADAQVPLEELQGGLEVPSDWLIAGHVERRLEFATAWTAPDALNPFCTSSDVPSTDGSVDCNIYTGVVRFSSSTPVSYIAADPADDVEITQPFESFRGALGSWVLAR